MFVQKISSFRPIIDIINSKKKTLVICDIDDTILFYDKTINYFIEFVKKDFPNWADDSIKTEAGCYYNTYRHIATPKHTDFDGFMSMIETIKSTNNNFLFLTARTNYEKNSNITKKHFNDIGLHYDDFTIHYTNNLMSKGRYIKTNIDISSYESVIFIDDYETYIKTVTEHFPHIICYQFVNKHPRISNYTENDKII
jgi:hypothetical protein